MNQAEPNTPGPRRDGEVGRRSFLRAMGAGLGGAVAAGGVAGATTAASAATPPAAVPFHGAHQAGAITRSSTRTTVVSYDVTAENRQELVELFRTLTDRARFLMAGGTPPPVGISAPPSDSGVLGPVVPADGLIATVGVGSSLFDDRFGLAQRRPTRLVPMRTFPNDDLDPAWCHGDLSLQLSANHEDTVLHALRDVARHTRGGMQVRWRLDGFTSPPRPSGVPRNHFGFMDGISNPDVTDQAQMDRLVWIDGSHDQPWTTGGSYLVVRLIRMLTEFWDRIGVYEQEDIFGRRRDSGAPLDGTRYTDIPDYALDPVGAAIPLTAHMRLANPRTPQTADSFILRRAYSYDRGVDNVGDLDLGLIFTCYQQDPLRQFEAIQTRLVNEPLVDYISPFGGGYFLVLPGVRDTADYLGRGMLAA